MGEPARERHSGAFSGAVAGFGVSECFEGEQGTAKGMAGQIASAALFSPAQKGAGDKRFPASA